MDEEIIAFFIVEQCVKGVGWTDIIEVPIVKNEKWNEEVDANTQLQAMRDSYVREFMNCERFYLTTDDEAVIVNVKNGPLRFHISRPDAPRFTPVYENPGVQGE